MSILRLHGILKEYRGPLRADFRREYGIDLDAALVPGSPAYVRPAVMLDLIDGLSQQAAYWRAVAPDDAGWGLREQLLAQQIDDFRLFCWGMGGGKGKRPEPIPRPGKRDSDTKQVQVIGQSEGFNSIKEFEAWYRRRASN